MEKRGCARISMGNWDKPIEFDANWSHAEVERFFQGLLPIPFGYAEAQAIANAGKGKAKARSLWVLLGREQRRLEVVHTKASGKDLVRYKGSRNVGPERSNIYIGKKSCMLRGLSFMSVAALRDAVPPDVYDSWVESDGDDDDNDNDNDSASEVETECGKGMLPCLGHRISASYL